MSDAIRREGRVQWLAGLFLGEGCINTSWRTKNKDEFGEERIQLCNDATIVNTDKSLIDEAETICRENDIKPIVYCTKKELPRRNLWVIKIVGNNKLRKFLTLLLPYLIGFKGDATKEMLSLIDYRLSTKHWDREMKVGDNPIIKERMRRIKSLNQHETLNDFTPGSSKEEDDKV